MSIERRPIVGTLDERFVTGERPMRSKYGAKRTEVDGILFASQKEAKRYQELKLLQLAGEIIGLEMQPRFPLYVRSPNTIESKPIGAYRGDFCYTTKDGRRVVEDVKGFKTPLYKWKKRHVEAQYGIQILET